MIDVQACPETATVHLQRRGSYTEHRGRDSFDRDGDNWTRPSPNRTVTLIPSRSPPTGEGGATSADYSGIVRRSSPSCPRQTTEKTFDRDGRRRHGGRRRRESSPSALARMTGHIRPGGNRRDETTITLDRQRPPGSWTVAVWGERLHGRRGRVPSPSRSRSTRTRSAHWSSPSRPRARAGPPPPTTRACRSSVTFNDVRDMSEKSFTFTATQDVD